MFLIVIFNDYYLYLCNGYRRDDGKLICRYSARSLKNDARALLKIFTLLYLRVFLNKGEKNRKVNKSRH